MACRPAWLFDWMVAQRLNAKVINFSLRSWEEKTLGTTSIEWTKSDDGTAGMTWNPLRAYHRNTGKRGHYCEKVSPCCANCYASAFQRRFGLPEYTGPSHRLEALDVVKPFLDESVLKQPLGWKRPRRVFVESMSDLFGDWVNNEWIHRVFAVMALAPQHSFQVLTKRAERMRDFMNHAYTPRNVAEWMAGNAMVPAQYKDYTPPWPPPNVWCGVSVEDQQRANERIPLLCQTPAAVRFLSVEPLLGPVTLLEYLHPDLEQCHDFSGISWIILGGESGPGARPCHLDWVRALVQECREAECPVFVKQLGAAPCMAGPLELGLADSLVPYGPLRDKKGGTMEDWPGDLRIREWPQQGTTNLENPSLFG